jgi:UDP-glucose 4-epimerase
MKYKNILVTGGGGFIGSHITKELVKRGCKVIAVDQYLVNLPSVTFIKSSFTDKKLDPFLKNIDVVIHLAAIVGVDICHDNPRLVMETNYTDAKEFIDKCNNFGVKRFIFSSSSEVYGNSKKVPYKEIQIPSPVSLYGRTKILTEEYLRKIAKKEKMSVGIVRLFNVYGPGQNKNFVIPKFIKAAINNKPIQIFGDGKQIRCFTFISDAVEGIMRLVEYNESLYETINIGNSKETTINNLAEIVLNQVHDSNSKIAHLPYGKNGVRDFSIEILKRVPSITKAEKLLGWRALVSLEKGIARTIDSYD